MNYKVVVMAGIGFIFAVAEIAAFVGYHTKVASIGPATIDPIRDCLPYLLSAISIYMVMLTGKKRAVGWFVGLFGQIGWSVWILYTGTMGLIPMNLTLWFLYLKNYVAWEESQQ
jgi:hypothetical protein